MTKANFKSFVECCKYCKSRDIEQDTTLLTVGDWETNEFTVSSGIQVMCNDCQAEYTIYEKNHHLYNQARPPVGHKIQVRETPRVLAAGLQLLEDEERQTATA